MSTGFREGHPGQVQIRPQILCCLSSPFIPLLPVYIMSYKKSWKCHTQKKIFIMHWIYFHKIQSLPLSSQVCSELCSSRSPEWHNRGALHRERGGGPNNLFIFLYGAQHDCLDFGISVWGLTPDFPNKRSNLEFVREALRLYLTILKLGHSNRSIISKMFWGCIFSVRDINIWK